MRESIPPHNNTVRNRLKALADEYVMAKRKGWKAADQAYSPVEEKDCPFAVLQIDHTPLDIILVDDVYRRPVGNVSLSIADRGRLYTFCSKHDVMLWDRCPNCGNGIAFHRLEFGKPDLIDGPPLQYCWFCGFDLCCAPAMPVNKWNDRTFLSWSGSLRLPW